MVSPSTLVQSKDNGFTIIEILISLGLLAMVAALGLFISFDFYKLYAFRSERSTIVSVLQKARSQSLNNIDQVRHGVHFQNNPLQYVIFEGSSYDQNNPNNLVISAAYNISINHPALPFDIIFDQLNGSCITCSTPVDIKVSAGTSKSYDIYLNSEGRIDW